MWDYDERAKVVDDSDRLKLHEKVYPPMNYCTELAGVENVLSSTAA